MDTLPGSGVALTRRSTLRLAVGAGVAVAGTALLAACGGAAAPTAAAGGLTITPGTGGANKNWYNVVHGQLAVVFRGNDMWASADTFTYIDQKGSGPGTWSVLVVSQDNTSTFAKAGIMARSSLKPTSADVGVYVMPGNGVQIQHRTTTGGSEVSRDGVSLNSSHREPPVWLKLSTDGKGNWTAWDSLDGKTWSGQKTQFVDLGSSYRIGLAASAHNNQKHGVVTYAHLGGFKGKAFTCDLVGTDDHAAAPTAPPLPGP